MFLWRIKKSIIIGWSYANNLIWSLFAHTLYQNQSENSHDLIA